MDEYNPDEYHSDDLHIATPPCPSADANGYCGLDDHSHVSGGPVGVVTAYLTHRCSDWVIGGPSKIRALITDLQRILQDHHQ